MLTKDYKNTISSKLNCGMQDHVTLGIIGGLGPEETINYYRNIIDGYQLVLGGQEMPNIAIESLNLHQVLLMLGMERYSEVVEYIASSAEHLYQSGATFGVMCGNIPNALFHEVQEHTNLPLISEEQATIKYCIECDFRKLAFLDSQEAFEEIADMNKFQNAGIKIFLPSLDDQAFIHQFGTNILAASPKSHAQKKLLRIINNLINDYGVDAIMVAQKDIAMLLSKQRLNAVSLYIKHLHQIEIINKLVESI